MLKFQIADDHEIIRKGLKQILSEEYPTAFIDEVGDADAVLKKAVGSKWDLIICDISMPGRSGLDVVRDLKQNFPKLPVLIISVHPEKEYAMRVLKAGAAGFVSKASASCELVKAVSRVLQGRKYISESVAERMVDEMKDDTEKSLHEVLSNREFHVFRLVATGRGISGIAESLALSVTTVSTYRARVLTKMRMKTNAELTRYAIENKLI